jgi:hypothetical protein
MSGNQFHQAKYRQAILNMSGANSIAFVAPCYMRTSWFSS